VRAYHFDQIEVTLGGFDDDCTGGVLRAIKYHLPLKIRRLTEPKRI